MFPNIVISFLSGLGQKWKWRVALHGQLEGKPTAAVWSVSTSKYFLVKQYFISQCALYNSMTHTYFSFLFISYSLVDWYILWLWMQFEMWSFELNNLTEALFSFPQTHSGSVWRVTWAHPEFGQVLASCSFDRTAAVWEEIVGESNDKQRGLSHWVLQL